MSRAPAWVQGELHHPQRTQNALDPATSRADGSVALTCGTAELDKGNRPCEVAESLFLKAVASPVDADSRRTSGVMNRAGAVQRHRRAPFDPSALRLLRNCGSTSPEPLQRHQTTARTRVDGAGRLSVAEATLQAAR